MTDATRIGPITIDANATAAMPGQNPSGTSTNVVIDVRGQGTAAIQTITTTGLQYKIYASIDGGVTYAPIRTVNSAGTATAADTAIVASATVIDYVLVGPITHIRVTRTAGSGTFFYGAHPDPAVFFAATGALSITLDEFPAAETPADNLTNATATTRVNSLDYLFDGSAWDRAPGNSSDGALVNLGTNNDVTVTSGAINATLQAGTAVIGQVPSSLREVAVTFSCATGALTAGDVIADTQVVTNATRANDAPSYLVGFQLLDEDDQAVADMELYLLSANVSVGTEDSAISITDANARNILHIIKLDDTEFVDLINSKSATKGASKDGGPWMVIPASGTRNIYAALVTRGTPTQTASGITARLYFQDGQAGS